MFVYKKDEVANWLMVSHNSDDDEFGYSSLGHCTYEEAIKKAKKQIDSDGYEIENYLEHTIESYCYPTLKHTYGGITCADFHVDFDIVRMDDFMEEE